MSELTYEDYKSRLKMQDLLTDAGYAQNKRDGLRYPSYSRHDSIGRRVNGDKFVITPDGNYCFQPPVMKVYNVISFIKEHPDLFQDYTPGMDLNRLVNLVCSRLLNQPTRERPSQDFVPQHKQTFNLDDYALVHFTDDRTEQHKFFPFFVHRGINWYTQNAFRNYFVRATHLVDSNPKQYANLSFPLTLPEQKECVGFEERGMRRADGTAYKGKAVGSNSSEGLWIASPAGTPLPEAKAVYWFESGYDAMAYYQLHQKADSQLRQAVFVSTGGNPTVGQMRGMLAHTPSATHHICFDNDLAGRQFTENLKNEIHRAVRASIEVTPERKPYLDSFPSHQDFTYGETDLLPKPLQERYAMYEAAWEETMSMRECGLSNEGDIKEQQALASRLYKDYRQGLRDFLGIVPEQDTSYVREEPKYGHKDWNEQLLAEIERERSQSAMQNPKDENTEERNTHYHR